MILYHHAHFFTNSKGILSDVPPTPQPAIGIIQGSILGPFLYSIYMSPLFDISELTSFADDNYIIRCHSNITQLKEDMSYHLEQIITWLKGSGLKVNQNKTEICIFHKNSCEVSNIMVDGTIVQTSDSINVLGVEFEF
jgi:hypothetical protein